MLQHVLLVDYLCSRRLPHWLLVVVVMLLLLLLCESRGPAPQWSPWGAAGACDHEEGDPGLGLGVDADDVVDDAGVAILGCLVEDGRASSGMRWAGARLEEELEDS